MEVRHRSKDGGDRKASVSPPSTLTSPATPLTPLSEERAHGPRAGDSPPDSPSVDDPTHTARGGTHGGAADDSNVRSESRTKARSKGGSSKGSSKSGSASESKASDDSETSEESGDSFLTPLLDRLIAYQPTRRFWVSAFVLTVALCLALHGSMRDTALNDRRLEFRRLCKAGRDALRFQLHLGVNSLNAVRAFGSASHTPDTATLRAQPNASLLSGGHTFDVSHAQYSAFVSLLSGYTTHVATAISWNDYLKNGDSDRREWERQTGLTVTRPIVDTANGHGNGGPNHTGIVFVPSEWGRSEYAAMRFFDGFRSYLGYDFFQSTEYGALARRGLGSVEPLASQPMFLRTANSMGLVLIYAERENETALIEDIIRQRTERQKSPSFNFTAEAAFRATESEILRRNARGFGCAAISFDSVHDRIDQLFPDLKLSLGIVLYDVTPQYDGAPIEAVFAGASLSEDFHVSHPALRSTEQMVARLEQFGYDLPEMQSLTSLAGASPFMSASAATSLSVSEYRSQPPPQLAGHYSFEFAGRFYRVSCIPRKGFIRSSIFPPLIAGAVLTLTVLIGWLYSILLSRRRAQMRTTRLARALELKRTAMDMNKTARREAEAANQSKSAFMAYLCHELRNPLHQVLALTEFLLETNQRRRSGVAGLPAPRLTATFGTANGSASGGARPATLPFATPSPPSEPISDRTSPANPVPQLPTTSAAGSFSLDGNVAIPVLTGGAVATQRATPTGAAPSASGPTSPHATSGSAEPSQARRLSQSTPAGPSAGSTPLADPNRRESSGSDASGSAGRMFATPAFDPTETEEEKMHLETIQSSASIMSTLLNDVLDMTKIEAGKMIFESVPFDVRQLVSTIVRAFTPSLKKKRQTKGHNVKLISNVADDIPRVVIGDSHRIRQVLSNLVSNAMKFTFDGHIRIRVFRQNASPFPVRDDVKLTAPSAAPSASMLAALADSASRFIPLGFAVDDTGVGMDEKAMKSLFDPYEQAKASTAREFGGTGLGLTIVRGLVEVMGGLVTVTSKVGDGSTFLVRLTMQLPDSNDPVHTAAASTVPAVASATPKLKMLSRTRPSPPLPKAEGSLTVKPPAATPTVGTAAAKPPLPKAATRKTSRQKKNPPPNIDSSVATRFSPSTASIQMPILNAELINSLGDDTSSTAHTDHTDANADAHAAAQSDNETECGDEQPSNSSDTATAATAAVAAPPPTTGSAAKAQTPEPPVRRINPPAASTRDTTSADSTAAPPLKITVGMRDERMPTPTGRTVVTMPLVHALGLPTATSAAASMAAVGTVSPPPADTTAAAASLPSAAPSAISLPLVSSGSPPTKRGKGFHVLVTDDSDINRKILGRILTNAGHHCSFATDGVQAIQAIAAGAAHDSDRPIDLIFMDIVMPVMDGLDATAKIRESGCTVPIVALTANAMTADQKRCSDVGMNAFLSKPFSARDISAAIKALLPSSSTAAAPSTLPPAVPVTAVPTVAATAAATAVSASDSAAPK